MPQAPCIVVDRISKKFRRGLNHDSLRDLIPSIARNWLRRPRPDDGSAFWALRDVSFHVEPGEALGIIGPNGAGKSTLLKLLSNIMKPDQGTIDLTGRLSSLIEVGAGFHADLTGRENIYLNGAILGMKKREIDRKLDTIVAFAELEDFIDTPIKRYSSGMQARLGFSVAAHMDPQILLVDEVLSVGDYHFQTKCLDKMRQFIDDSVTVVFVSHNMNAVGTLCTRCILLEQGQIVFAGEPAAAIERYYTHQRDKHDDSPRSESGNVRLESVSLEDVEGRKTGLYRNGQRAVLRTVIDSRIDAKVSVGMVLEDRRGFVVADTATTRLGHSAVSLRAGRKCEVAFSFAIRFTPGQYRLAINVEDPLSGTYHTFDRNVASFAVTDGHQCGGPCYIEPSVTVRAIDDAPKPARSPLSEEAPSASRGQKQPLTTS